MRYSRRRWSVMTKELQDAPRTLQRNARTTDRKEKHGYCQESCEEDRGQEAGCEEDGCEEAGREEERCEEARREEKRCEEARREEVGAGQEAPAERRVHEGDATVVATRSRRRHVADAAHGSDEEDLGLHQEEQAAGQREQAAHQRRRQAACSVRGQEQGVDVRDDEARLDASQVARFAFRRARTFPRAKKEPA